MISQEILDILACPVCKSDLVYTKQSFLCINCKLEYPIIDEIPVFLPEEAKKLSEEELQKIKENLNEG